MQYDIAVIGNDEAAFEMVRLAARLERRTVAVLPNLHHSAWFVSLALKRLVSELLVDQSPSRQRVLERVGSPSLLRRLISKAIVEEMWDRVQQLEWLGVKVISGDALFSGRGELAIRDTSGRRSVLSARHVIIGTGVRCAAAHQAPDGIPHLRPELLLAAGRLPQAATFLGGGAFGSGMAALFALFGVRSRYISAGMDDDAMGELGRAAGVEFLSASTEQAREMDDAVRGSVVVDGRRAVGFTEHLNLPGIGVSSDENCQLWCSGDLETWCPGVFGIGSVVGFSPHTHEPAGVQAECILSRLRRQVRRPRLLEAFVAAGDRAAQRVPVS